MDDLTGKTFGHYSVISPPFYDYRCRVRCACGVEKLVFQNSLTHATRPVRGCHKCSHSPLSGKPREDLTGQRFGKFTCLSKADGRKWNVRCDCGNVTAITNVKHRTSGCRLCTRGDATKHGKSQTRLYGIWGGMRNRCHVKPHPNYGLRGITVCEEWRDDFLAFEAWALANGYAADLTIDRIDNDRGYNPDNCRWATMTEQGRNKRNTKLTEDLAEELRQRHADGETVMDLARELGMRHQVISNAIQGQTWL